MKNPLDSKSNIALVGPAGVGKTYYINEYVKEHPNTLLCAPTGTAAFNIGGVTAHRLCGIPVPAYGGNVWKVPSQVIVTLAKADTLIIDEISMMRNDAFSFLVKVLNRTKEETGRSPRVVVSGDFSQLPPIVKKDEEKYFTKYGFDKSGYCFTTKEWADLKFEVVELTEIKRQDNREFIDNLNLARKGDTSCIRYFNQFYGKELNDGIYICGTNAEADRINNEYIDALDAVMCAYRAKTDGIIGKELPCDEIVLLKEGCRVMFTANDNPQECVRDTGSFDGNGRYTNGMFGTVQKVYADSVDVLTEDGREVNVTYHTWSIYKYTVERLTKALKKEEIGTIKQIPLKVARAITIHKSQGKTFDKTIISPQIFAPGQLYVALSRVRTPEGLVLTEPIVGDYLKIEPVVQRFYDNGYAFEMSGARMQSRIQKQKEIDKALKATKKKKTTKKRSSSRKTAAKKPAKKTTSKKATRKSPAKKTTRKPAAKKTAVKKKTATKKRTAKTSSKKATRKPTTKKTTVRRK